MIKVVSLVVFIIAIELFTIIVRYGFKISAKVSYEKILRKLGFKKMFHIHHMYFGIIIAVYSYMNNFPAWYNLGIALIITDLFHHFVVLRLVEGDSEFRFIHRI